MIQQFESLEPPPHSDILEVCALPGEPYRGQDANPATLLLSLETYRDAVVHYLYRMLQDRGAAEELALETFARMYRSAAITSNPADGWATRLFRIATQLAAQKKMNRGFLHKTAEARAGVLSAIVCMSCQQRSAVLLHKYQQMGYSQIASVLNCTESTAKKLLFSAYQLLRHQGVAKEGQP